VTPSMGGLAIRTIAIHQFGPGNAKIEQRVLLDNGRGGSPYGAPGWGTPAASRCATSSFSEIERQPGPEVPSGKLRACYGPSGQKVTAMDRVQIVDDAVVMFQTLRR
jgi:hypothetical protein